MNIAVVSLLYQFLQNDVGISLDNHRVMCSYPESSKALQMVEKGGFKTKKSDFNLKRMFYRTILRLRCKNIIL